MSPPIPTQDQTHILSQTQQQQNLLVEQIPHATLKNADYNEQNISTLEGLIKDTSLARSEWPLHDKDGKFIPMVHTEAEKKGKVKLQPWMVALVAAAGGQPGYELVAPPAAY